MFYDRPRAYLLDRLIQLPWLLVIGATALAGIGCVTLYSVAGGSVEPWAGRHDLRYQAALALAIGLAMVPSRLWRSTAGAFYIVALGLLAAVPIVGVDALGAKRWLRIAGVSVQPVEIMKVALVLALAQFYAALEDSRRASQPHWVLFALTIIAMPALLTVRQPDLGSAILLTAVGLGIMFLAGVSLWWFGGGLALIAAAMPFAPGLLHDYQRRRLETFLDPSRDPLGAGYHIAQARIALGNGGLDGQGYLHGTQSQLDFVPEKMTDFVFVAIAEEWGFVGAVTVLALYATVIVILFVMALKANGAFARLTIAGTALMLTVYVTINIAMVTGLVPVVGVPLPLISYGGTAMTTLMIALGVAMSANRRT